MKSSKVVVQNLFLHQFFSPDECFETITPTWFFLKSLVLFSSAIAKKTNVLEESILKVFCINTRGNGWPRSMKGWKGNSAAKDSPASFLKVVGCVQQRRKSWVHSEAVISHLGAHYFLRSVKVKIRAIFKRVCTWAKSDTEKTGCQKLQVRGQQEI